MSDEVTVQMAVAPEAAAVAPEPAKPVVEQTVVTEAELAAAQEKERTDQIGNIVAAVEAEKELEQKQLDQLQQAIDKQEAYVKKKLAEVAKASEKKIRSPKVEELKNQILGHMPYPPSALKMKHFKDSYGSSYTDDEYEQALKELVENGSVQVIQGWYFRKRDSRGG